VTDVFEVSILPEVIADLVAQRMHPLDRITLRDRVRAFRREVFRTRGRMADTVPLEPPLNGGVRFVFDRPDGVLTTYVERRRSWKWLWFEREVTVISVVSLRLMPLRSGE
jgi:hypothetical protein